MGDRPNLLDVVAVPDGLPEASIERGQVGIVVGLVDDATVIVEFSDEEGDAHTVLPLPIAKLVPIHHEPTAT